VIEEKEQINDIINGKTIKTLMKCKLIKVNEIEREIKAITYHHQN
jgi:hypothetical protein